MIEIVRLYNTVQQLAKTGTSGYQNQDEFNNDVEAVQDDLMSLSFIDSASQSLKDIFDPFSVSADLTTDVLEMINKPSDYYRGRTAQINGYPCYPISVNEKDIWNTSPIRKPSVATNIYVYYQEDDKIKFLPAQTLNVEFSYLRKPNPAIIVLTASSDAEGDYLTASSGGDLEWNSNVFNLFVYKMLERLGMEMKESLSMEYANLGIQKEIAKI